MSFTPIYDDPRMGSFYESDIQGGVGPDGSNGAATSYGISYFFVGLAGNGHSIWAPRYADYHTYLQATEASILAALATVGGVWYYEIYPADAQTKTCSVYQAADPNWPAPGPNYVRIGTSGAGGIPDFSLGAGLPLYARVDADPLLISFALLLTRGTP